MKILKIEPLVWKISAQRLTCFVCHDEDSISTWRVSLKHRDMDLNISLCESSCKLLNRDIFDTTAKSMVLIEKWQLL